MRWLIHMAVIVLGMLFPICAMAGSNIIINKKADKESGLLKVRAFVPPRVQIRLMDSKPEVTGSGAVRGKYKLLDTTDERSQTRQITFSPF